MSEVIDLTLQGQGYGGDAYGRDADGRMVFVPFGLQGERVRVEIVEARKRWARARPLEVLEPATDRIEKPRCRHFGVCGGCHYQHMDYPAQLKVKADIVREQLERIGGFEDPPVDAAVPSPEPWNYRNNLRFSLTPEGALGFVTVDRETVFALEECHLPEAPLDDLWRRLDVDGVEGIRGVSVRRGSDDAAMIVLHADGPPQVELTIDLPASVVWLSPEGTAVLAGDEALEFKIRDRAFRVSAGSFFQVNTGLLPELIDRVLEALAVRAGETVFDLYAGVGTFSAFIAGEGARLVAVEESPQACSDFEVNLAEFDEVSLYESPVEAALPLIEDDPDAVLVDPPRSGLDRSVVDELVRRRPERLVYVSCDPATLARDGKRLSQGGYVLQRVTPLDLFPQTFHIEALSIWKPARR